MKKQLENKTKYKEIIHIDSNLFKTICKVIKHDKAQYPNTFIKFADKTNKINYKLEFDWQDENICGLKVLKEIS